jgi:hypothetical protein
MLYKLVISVHLTLKGCRASRRFGYQSSATLWQFSLRLMSRYL